MNARMITTVAVGALLLLGACSSGDDDDSAAEDRDAAAPTTAEATTTTLPPVADVTGPITTGTRPANLMPPDFADRYGYVEDEFFVSGEATAYAPVGELTADGFWTAEPSGTAPYTTRVIVRQPENPADFNGIVAVEWLNVTSGTDADPDFGMLHPVLLGEGYAYVAVSAQQVSIGDGSGGVVIDLPGIPAELLQPLKVRDPVRYGSLSHPGDDYSYDIATQVGQLARSGHLLDGVPADQVLLVGESQSASRMTTYINAVHPVARAYDGFLVHSRFASGAPLAAGAPIPPEAVTIRTDLDVPVLQFETETDLVRLRFLQARQPDTDRIVTWEVAGTAHADNSQIEYGQAASGTSVDVTGTCPPINTGPQAEVLRAAFVALTNWVVDGSTPPSGPRIESTGDALVRDERGIAVGGIRTPDVDAPVSVLSGENNAESVICSLFGSTVAFTPEQLAELYPTHDDYVDAVTASADAAVDAGFLLPADRDAIVEAAQAADVPT